MDEEKLSIIVKEKVSLNTNNYKNVSDSLIISLNSRISKAKMKPNGIGRQLKNAKPNFEPKRINSSKKSNNSQKK